MKTFLFWISAVLILAFWPLSFILSNSDSWVPFILAASLVLLDYFLFRTGNKLRYFIYLLLPLIHPAYLLIPFLIFLLNIKNFDKTGLFIFSFLLFLVSLFSWKTFYAYSIFTPDPLAKDTLIKKISLIPNRNLARIFENKTTVFQNKYKANLFVSLDPNNYFFALHPRESGDNQNLIKYSYLAIIPFLLGLFYLKDSRDKAWLVSVFLAMVLSISFINNQDRFDILLCVPVSIMSIFGLKKLKTLSAKYFLIFSVVFVLISFIELARIIIYRS
ncbi:MAG: hypothetical protein ACD_61C00071G0010 [uncultured bacterium]|nr:MAG: hypothetical protein ACD_61C00071G0010 [uncultured bacterium]